MSSSGWGRRRPVIEEVDEDAMNDDEYYQDFSTGPSVIEEPDEPPHSTRHQTQPPPRPRTDGRPGPATAHAHAHTGRRSGGGARANPFGFGFEDMHNDFFGMSDPFDMFGGGLGMDFPFGNMFGGGGGKRQRAAGAGSMRSMMPWGQFPQFPQFPDMTRMDGMGDSVYSSSYSSSFSQGPDGHVRETTSRRTQAPGRVIEESNTERDSRTGVQRMGLRRQLGERGRHMEQWRVGDGPIESTESYHGMHQDDAHQFDHEWTQSVDTRGMLNAGPMQPPQAALHDRPSRSSGREHRRDFAPTAEPHAQQRRERGANPQYPQRGAHSGGKSWSANL